MNCVARAVACREGLEIIGWLNLTSVNPIDNIAKPSLLLFHLALLNSAHCHHV